MTSNSRLHSDTDQTDHSLPAHIAVIMDGNGRWAKRKGLSRTQGHREGLETAKTVVKRASEYNIPYITLFTFSTENWKRASDEVGFLMGLIKTHLRSELAFYTENEIRVRFIGDPSGLPADILEEIRTVEKDTEVFSRTTVVLAINYGGKDEIVRALRKIPSDKIESCTEKDFLQYLDIPEMPPVDLLIRTGGERRISNFLLWQSAYAELYFSDLLWPDWNGDCLDEAIADYKSRERRFGGTT